MPFRPRANGGDQRCDREERIDVRAGQRVSSRVLFGEPPITRKLAVRLFDAQVGLTGAQNPSTSRFSCSRWAEHRRKLERTASCPAR